MKAVLSLLNALAGPIGGLVEKGILAGVMYAVGAGWLKGDAAGLAATIYAAVSAVFTAAVNSQTAKAQSIVETQGNGITVVTKSEASAAGIQSVTAPVAK